jgi:hypothetical protein
LAVKLRPRRVALVEDRRGRGLSKALFRPGRAKFSKARLWARMERLSERVEERSNKVSFEIKPSEGELSSKVAMRREALRGAGRPSKPPGGSSRDSTVRIFWSGS